jgi:hypothetical protein
MMERKMNGKIIKYSMQKWRQPKYKKLREKGNCKETKYNILCRNGKVRQRYL